jgi:hypothetical protein
VIDLPSRVRVVSISPLSSPRLFDDGNLIRLTINYIITNKLKHLIGDISALRNVATKYFKSIHRWFLILLELSYYEHLIGTLDRLYAKYSLLSLSIILVTTTPPIKESLDTFTSLYILIKSSITIIKAININSMEII